MNHNEGGPEAAPYNDHQSRLRWSRTLWRREGHHRYLCARSKRGIIGSFSRYLGMAMRQNSRCPKICDAHRIIINMYNRISHNKYSFLCSEYKVWNFVTYDHQSRVKQSCTWGPSLLRGHHRYLCATSNFPLLEEPLSALLVGGHNYFGSIKIYFGTIILGHLS